MRLFEKVKNWRLFQAGLKPFKEIIDPGRKIDADDDKWVSLGSKVNRDLSVGEQDWLSSVAYHQWLTDPLAGRIVEILTDFVIGSGIKVNAKEEDVQTVIDEMWYDEINDFPSQQITMCSEFTVFGELIPVPFVNPISGLCQFSRIDPTTLKDVIPDPQFSQVPMTVCLKSSKFMDKNNEYVTELRVIHRDKDPRSPTAGRLTGDVFYFAQGRLGGKRRGHTQLLRTHEWIDIYNKRLFNEAERQEHASAYVWDVSLKGATKETAKEFLDNMETPSAASVRVHGDDVEWNVLTPDLKSADFSESNRQFLQVVLGAYGIPEFWFALGGEVNFATAKAMSEPTVKAFQRQQRNFKTVIEKLVDYQIEKAYQANRLSHPTAEFEVQMDEISASDMSAVAGAIVQFAVALQTAEAQGWINKEESAKAYAKLFGESGVDVEAVEPGEADAPPQIVDAANALVTALSEAKKKNPRKKAIAKTG